jgi:hypothetical protein
MQDPTSMHCSRIVELRQYTLYPAQREVLIHLFERLFVIGQEEAGIAVIGQFRDLDDPNRFVWLRGFPDMPSRARSLSLFYDGMLWKSNRDAANATMVDSDNVLLLHPARGDSAFTAPSPSMKPDAGAGHSKGFVAAGIEWLGDSEEGPRAVDEFEKATAPAIAAVAEPCSPTS